MEENGSEGKQEDPGLLHVYGQEAYHDEAYVVGNFRGLEALRDAIDRVLEEDVDQASEWVSVSDGEGYDIKVIKVDDPWYMKTEHDENGEVKGWYSVAPPGSRWEWIAAPYTDEDWGKERREVALWPSKLWKYPYAMPPLTMTVAEYLGDRADGAPLVDAGDEIECPHCGKKHPTYVIDGMDGERLLVFQCQQTNGANELIAGFSDGDHFRMVARNLQIYGS